MIPDDAISISNWKSSGFLLASFFCLGCCHHCLAQDRSEASTTTERWAVIFVGLPGDVEHASTFDETAIQLQVWLTQALLFPKDHVTCLPTQASHDARSLSAELIRSTLNETKQKLHPDDSLWVFLLGNGNYDGKRAWFHVKGRDPSGDEIGRWIADIECREQVIWLTQSSSGWFLKPLSRQGRIVIAATAADDESNETEFPLALRTVAQWPVSKLDRDEDNVVTVAELYAAVVSEVMRRFASDNRLPTEHAQIDDNGDGIGTEDIQKAIPDDPNSQQPRSKAMTDGDLAKRTIVPYRDAKPGDRSPAAPDRN